MQGLSRWLCTILLFLMVSPPCGFAQGSGGLTGKVTYKLNQEPIADAAVEIVELGLEVHTDAEGRYEFNNIPSGSYHLNAHLHQLTTAPIEVEISEGTVTTADISLSFTPFRQEITVTASGQQESTFESFQSVESIGPYDLAVSTDVSLGEMLDHRVGTGIAKRSFGPGSARPVIRGFDGDRVLIMEDGIRTGTLSSQSGDHGELINPAQLERLEIVKGPATLLYSGNAMGGTVNAVSRHHEIHRHPHEGMSGFLSGSGGTTNSLGGGSAGFEYGKGKWMFWGQGGGIRTGDYTAPEQGRIFNSRSRITNGGGGFGWYGEKMFFSLDGKHDDGAYGVPFVQEFHGHHGEEEAEHDEEEGEHDEEEEGEHDEEEGEHDEEEGEHDEEEGEYGHGEEEIERIRLDSQRRRYRVNWGLKDLSPALENFVLKVSYTDWSHKEIEISEDGDQNVGTKFDQRQFVYRGVFEQGTLGPLSGRFGIWGLDRKYTAVGEEALSPPVDQTGFAVFALEELDFETVKFQFGGRLETQRYTPAFAERSPGHEEESHGPEEEGAEEPGEEIVDAVRRTFTGASASAGVHVKTWHGGAFVVNYSHSYRAPALEELYNFGPHAGNLAFEIGDPSLLSETGNGVDLALRHKSDRLGGELNLFYYDFDNFIFPFATGEREDGLQVIEFTQRNARFLGTEANLHIGLHPKLWLNLGLDFVDAQDMDTNTPLPRIPPLRGKVGLDFNHGGFRVTPELILASQQHQTFTGETRTPGYGVLNLKASYTYAQQHLAHQFAVRVFNLGDRLYRNHSSFIKDLAPEIGRGVRVTYSVRFF